VRRVVYTRAAERDLAEIAEYTLEYWGAQQCEKYLDLLEQTCEQIIPQNLRHTRSVPDRPALRRWRCERHVIYLRVLRENAIEIVRVLHERMLPESHL